MIEAITSVAQADPLANQANSGGIPQAISNAIRTAAARTGVNFAYLVNKASQESSFNPNAQASTSSATGLYQFTGQTWLQMIKTHGAEYGLSNYAAHITIDDKGIAHASDPTWRTAILNLRKDPTVSAEMAGELDKANMSTLKTSVGGKINATDLYLAHFLGAGGATNFIQAMRANPGAPAANVVPDAAASNTSVFYNAQGQPRSLSQIYQHFAQKFDASPATTLVASAAPATGTASTVPQSVTSNITLANAVTTSTPAHNYSPFGLSDIKAGSNSLYNAMALAQMNIDGMHSLSVYDGLTKTHGVKNNTVDTTAGLA